MEIELQNVTIGSLKRHYKVLEFFFFYNSILRKSSFKRREFS